MAKSICKTKTEVSVHKKKSSDARLARAHTKYVERLLTATSIFLSPVWVPPPSMYIYVFVSVCVSYFPGRMKTCSWLLLVHRDFPNVWDFVVFELHQNLKKPNYLLRASTKPGKIIVFSLLKTIFRNFRQGQSIFSLRHRIYIDFQALPASYPVSIKLFFHVKQPVLEDDRSPPPNRAAKKNYSCISTNSNAFTARHLLRIRNKFTFTVTSISKIYSCINFITQMWNFL